MNIFKTLEHKIFLLTRQLSQCELQANEQLTENNFQIHADDIYV